MTSPTAPAAARRLPPVDVVAVTSMALVIITGIYLAAHLPRTAPLGLPVGLLTAAWALLLGDMAVLSRLRPFAWTVFRRVAGWALLAYAVIAGLLELVFLLDHTRGAMLVMLTLSLVVFAIDIPLLFGFSVARYQPADVAG
jgi:hypothetical protein